MSTSIATPVVHMLAAGLGEIFACLVRVPTEIIKQRLQVGMHGSIVEAAKAVVLEDGALGMYRGLYATIFREIPFALVQFPLYEELKASVSHFAQRDPTAYEAAFCKLSYTTILHISPLSCLIFIYNLLLNLSLHSRIVFRWPCCSRDYPTRCSEDEIDVRKSKSDVKTLPHFPQILK
jgi:hypothetical protein